MFSARGAPLEVGPLQEPAASAHRGAGVSGDGRRHGKIPSAVVDLQPVFPDDEFPVEGTIAMQLDIGEGTTMVTLMIEAAPLTQYTVIVLVPSSDGTSTGVAGPPTAHEAPRFAGGRTMKFPRLHVATASAPSLNPPLFQVPTESTYLFAAVPARDASDDVDSLAPSAPVPSALPVHQGASTNSGATGQEQQQQQNGQSAAAGGGTGAGRAAAAVASHAPTWTADLSAARARGVLCSVFTDADGHAELMRATESLKLCAPASSPSSVLGKWFGIVERGSNELLATGVAVPS